MYTGSRVRRRFARGGHQPGHATAVKGHVDVAVRAADDVADAPDVLEQHLLVRDLAVGEDESAQFLLCEAPENNGHSTWGLRAW